jgi:hypothetical protein
MMEMILEETEMEGPVAISSPIIGGKANPELLASVGGQGRLAGEEYEDAAFRVEGQVHVLHQLFN